MTLRDVSNLAGLCRTRAGRRVAFAVLGRTAAQGDRIARAIVRAG